MRMISQGISSIDETSHLYFGDSPQSTHFDPIVFPPFLSAITILCLLIRLSRAPVGVVMSQSLDRPN